MPRRPGACSTTQTPRFLPRSRPGGSRSSTARRSARRVVRGAAAKYAIDYDGIVSGIMRRHGRRIGGIMMPGMLGFPESLNTALLYRHDQAKAVGLMKEAGVSKASVPLTWAAGTNYGALPLD